MFDGLILAAGRSQRAGVFKPGHRWRGKPLLRHAVDVLAPWCDRIVIVSGHGHDEAAALTAGLRDVALVRNPDPDRGMFSSVQVGAAAVSPDARGFFVLPVDCPVLEAGVARALIDAFAAGDGSRCVVPEYRGRGGHPALLPAAARQAILEASFTGTLRDIIGALGAARVAVASSSVLTDLDTADDLARLDTADHQAGDPPKG
jgi:molybdenum cofactor cytidylyltransferase